MISVVFYRDEDGTCPLLEWLDSLPRRVQDKCVVRIEGLREKGRAAERDRPRHPEKEAVRR